MYIYSLQLRVTDLPTELIAAFRATLEEVREADLLVHVPNMAIRPGGAALRCRARVASLGLAEEGPPRRIEAWNKVDLLSVEERQRLTEEAKRRDDVVPISAITGEGLNELRERMAECLRSGEQIDQIRVSATDGGHIAWLHSRGEVLDQNSIMMSWSCPYGCHQTIGRGFRRRSLCLNLVRFDPERFLFL